MHASDQCQGRGCERKAECERYTDTKNWPFPVMSKLCDSRYMAFIEKPQAARDKLETDHQKAIAEAQDALRKVPEPQPFVFVTHDGKGGMKTITEEEALF